jgi:DNA-binding transcriptional LysR family regulator
LFRHKKVGTPTMDLNLLNVFIAIYRERNLTRAAERLGISPAGVSAALRRLRNEFGDTLFIRKAHGVEPTVRADAIAEKFGMALELVEQAKKPDRAFNPAQEDRAFVIGMSDYSQAIILPSLLRLLRESAPGISLAIRHTGGIPVRQSLDAGAFDLVIGNVIAPLGRIRQQHLLTEAFNGVVARTHPLASKTFEVEELNKYPALLTEAHGGERWWEHPMFKASGYAPNHVISIPGFLGVSLLLLDSPLVCVTTRRLSAIFTKVYPLAVIPLPFDEQPILIRQYWHERLHNDPAHRWLRQSVYQVCKALE